MEKLSEQEIRQLIKKSIPASAENVELSEQELAIAMVHYQALSTMEKNHE